jgi:hypothetical protein
MFFIVALFFVIGTGFVHASADASQNTRFFSAVLTGSEEVPPVVTDASGEARFTELSHSLRFGLKIYELDDHTAAHIHCAPAGSNGPVGVTLPFVNPVSLPNGVQYSGLITAPDAGNACGWITIKDVLDAMRMGNAYVNVHSATVPSGEIRGQITQDTVAAGELF